MQIQIKTENRVVTVYDPSTLTLSEALELAAAALRATGYVFNGDLEVVDNE